MDPELAFFYTVHAIYASNQAARERYVPAGYLLAVLVEFRVVREVSPLTSCEFSSAAGMKVN